MRDYFQMANDAAIDLFEDTHKISVAYFEDGDEFSVVCSSCGSLFLDKECDCLPENYLKELQVELDVDLDQ